ncbi:Anaphase-promoting complex subunit 11 [Smittium culicis]|uniref:Anaphase-promoting complex subunit 11 n=1 Tax=Smittium culicis TaxID=133412 RepID=A0A1R1YBA1_9FUNG|nr:Anaphase-promoting complex subunit 11 [Smittium culicis]
MKIRINKLSATAFWNWDVKSKDICGICRLEYESSCPECLYPGTSCPIQSGSCGHTFHDHCINKWLTSENSTNICPMDRTVWIPLP